MYKVILKPQDLLFFRDGKPFGTSDSSYAETIFPPYPSSIAGALRALIIDVFGGYDKFKNGELKEQLENVIGKIVKENGDKEKFVISDGLKIKRVILKKNGTKYYYVPADIGEFEVGNEKILKKFNWVKKSNLPFESLMDEDYEVLMFNSTSFELKPKSGYFPEDIFKSYLLDELCKNQRSCSAKGENEFYENEDHIKNKLIRDKKTTPEVGGVYMTKMKRVKEGVEFEVVFDVNDNGFYNKLQDNISNYGSKFIPLGGENKLSYFEIAEDDGKFLIDFDEFEKNYDKNKDYLKLVLLTPSIVKNKVPENLNDLFKVKGISIKGQTSIGGWDTAQKIPKPMYKAYLPGTVFIVEPKGNFDKDFYEKVLNTNFSDDIGEHLKPFEGFGIIALGIEKNIKGGE